MCGSYYIEVDNRELEEIAAEIRRNIQQEDNVPDEEQAKAVYADDLIRPTNIVPVLALRNKEPQYTLQKWGFPGYGEHPTAIINARSETVMDRKSFKFVYPKQRCVIPASGFYESRHEGKKVKEKYAITQEGQSVIHMAGIYNYFAIGKILFPHFVILTTEPSAAVSRIHDRMPVLLDEDELEEYMTDLSYADMVLKRPGKDVILREVEKPKPKTRGRDTQQLSFFENTVFPDT